MKINMNKKSAFTLAEVLIPKRVSEIKNKVFNFRGSKIKAPFNLNKKLVAFTLAEVLIPKRVSGIDNKVKYSRASEIKAPFNLNKKLVAFTLAEVLITLAIIGVVAALTIPGVVAKYQKKMYYTQFMKVYNTLSDALSLAQAEHGFYDTWTGGGDTSQAIKTNLYPYLKISKDCDVDTEGDCEVISDFSSSIKSLNNGNITDLYIFDFSGQNIVLMDGALISLAGSANKIDIMLDTNGAIKGPNTMGRDVFSLSYSKVDGKYQLFGDYMLTNEGVLRSREELEAFFNESSRYLERCSTSEKSQGWGCSSRLLLEGKMDY